MNRVGRRFLKDLVFFKAEILEEISCFLQGVVFHLSMDVFLWSPLFFQPVLWKNSLHKCSGVGISKRLREL